MALRAPVERRRNFGARGDFSGARNGAARGRDQGVIDHDRHALTRSGEVNRGRVAEIAVLTQEEHLGAELRALGQVGLLR